MNAQLYLWENETHHGPYDEEKILEKLDLGKISWGTLAAYPKAKSWLPLFFILKDLRSLPTPLAYPLHSYLKEEDPRIRLWSMIDFCEMFCRMLTFAFLADLEKTDAIDPDTRIKIAQWIYQPSFGSWLNCALELSKNTKLSQPLHQCKGFLEKPFLGLLRGKEKPRTDESSLIEMRNRMAHYGPISIDEAKRMLMIWEPQFESVITHSGWLTNCLLLGKNNEQKWCTLQGALGSTTPCSDLELPEEEEPDAVWLRIEDLNLRLWPMAAFGRPSMEAEERNPDKSNQDSRKEHSQIYVRREQVRLGYFPVGAQGIGKSDSSISAREAYDRLFPTRSFDHSKDFQVIGWDKEILQEAGNMVGRADQIKDLLEKIRQRKNGVLWIDGLPGMGKSALIAKIFAELSEDRADPNQTVLAYRFRANQQDRCNRNRFAQFVIERLMANDAIKETYEDQPKDEAEKRLENALGQLREDRSLVLMLDGLDEIHLSDPSFVEEIPLSLRFSKVLWVCSSRPEPGIKEPMHRLSAERVFAEGLPPMNEDDVRAMFMEKLGPLQRKKLIANEQDEAGNLHSPFIQQVTERAGGLPLYVVYAIGDVLNGTYRVLDGEENLPPSLDAYHAKLIEKLGIGALHEILTPLAAGLAVAREPLSQREIFQLLLSMNRMEKDEEELLDRALLALSGMLSTAPDPEGEIGYRLFHQSLKEHILQNQEMEGPVKRAKRAFADLAENSNPPSELKNYLLRCGIDHLLEVDRKQEAEQLLLDLHHLYAMHQQGVEEIPIYRYWERLGGENRAMQYLDSVEKTLERQGDEDIFQKVDLVSDLAVTAYWTKIGVTITEKILVARKNKLGHDHPDVATSYNNLGAAYKNKGEYDRAIEYYEKSLKIRLDKLGYDHLDIATSNNNLGSAYGNMGEYDRAIEHYEESLKIRLEKLGHDHPDVASSYNNLGAAYDCKGEYGRAIKYYEKSLRINLEKLGHDHPYVASSYNNLGAAYHCKGEYDRAIEHYEKSLKIRLDKLGHDHPDVASSYNNLGSAYDYKGEYDRAIEYYEKSLKIRLEKLGHDHPNVASSYNGLAVAYGNKGEYDRAIEYYEKSLKIRLEKLGHDHPNVADSYNGLAAPYYYKGEYDRAIEYYEKSLRIWLEKLGHDHPNVASSYNNLGSAYDCKGEYDRAIEHYEKSLKVNLEKLGHDHPDVATSYEGLALPYCNKGEYDRAIEYYEKSLKIRLDKLGHDHPDIASSYNGLALPYGNKGEYDRAIEYYEKSLRISLEKLGHDHPQVALSYNNLGSAHDNKGEYDRAIEYYEKSLKIWLEKLGHDHPDVATSYNNLGAAYKNKGELDKAGEYQAMSRWSELRAKGNFMDNIDPVAFEKEVGIPYPRAKEIEEELKGFCDL